MANDRHQQLNVCDVREHVGQNENTRRRRLRPVPTEIADEVIRAEAAQVKRRSVGCWRTDYASPGRRESQDARAELASVRQRPTMWMKDVGVEHVKGIDHERVRDPRHVPDRELTVEAVSATEAARVKR